MRSICSRGLPYETLYMLQHFMNNTFKSLDYQKLSAAAVVMAPRHGRAHRAALPGGGLVRKGCGGMKKKRYFSRGVMFVLCLVFAVAFLLPTVLTITNSFMSEAEIKANYGMIFSTTSGGYVSKTVNLKFIPDKVTLSQYITGLVKSPDYLLKFWNSIILVVPIVILQVAIASVAAYSFTLAGGQNKKRYLLFSMSSSCSCRIRSRSCRTISCRSGWGYSTRWSIILPGMFAPFSVFLLTKFMRRIPYSLIEAAKVDGAGEWEIFTKICLPQCRSALYSIAILVFIDYWNMVEQPLILLEDADQQPLSVFLSSINSGEIGLAFCNGHGLHDPDASAVPPRRGISCRGDCQLRQRQGLTAFARPRAPVICFLDTS